MEKITPPNNQAEGAPRKEGEKFETFSAFYEKMRARRFPVVFLSGKKLEKSKQGDHYEIVDDPSEKLEIRFHKIVEHYGNVNIYKDRELVKYFRLDNSNIKDFSFEFRSF